MTRSKRSFVFVVAALALFTALPASAHVAITVPESDAVLIGGSTVQLSWYDSIVHQTEAYDIDFLEYPGAEPMVIAHDVPPDVKTYDWVVPEASCTECFVRVFQRNINYASFDHTLPIVIDGVDTEPAKSENACSLSGRPGSAQGRGWFAFAFAFALLFARLRRRR